MSQQASQVGGATPLSREQVAQAARLLAEALHDDPAYAFVFPSGSRPGALAEFFRRHLSNHVPHRCAFARAGTRGDVEATVTLRPPGGVPVSRFALWRAFVPFAFAHGFDVLGRLSRVQHHYEALEQRAAPGGRYWHVHMMGVRPDLQGKGIGGALLDDVLATTRGSALPVVLTTHKEINVRFYRRAGFEVAFEEDVPLPASRAFRVWCMRRAPRS
jgi:ribosomal protein S18 acetylase RimI-like enzyme